MDCFADPVSVAAISGGIVAVLGALGTLWKDVKGVKKLVNGNNSRKTARVEQLTELLAVNGIAIPPLTDEEGTE